MLLTLSHRTDMNGQVTADALRFQSAFSLLTSVVLLGTFMFRLQMGLFDYPSAPVVTGALLLMAAALSGVFASFRQDRIKRAALSLIPLVQLMIVVGMVYYSGGIASSLLGLLLVPALSAMFISLPFALSVSLSAIALFIVMSVGGQVEWWGFVERTGYTTGQLAAVNVLRLILLLAITVSGVILVLVHHMRRVYRLLEAREEDIFALAQGAEEAFTRALDAASPEAARGALEEGLDLVRSAAGGLSDDAVPLARMLNVMRVRACNACGIAIDRFSFYYGIPAAQRVARLMGAARNDVHCVPCHRRQNDCTVCAVWAQAAS